MFTYVSTSTALKDRRRRFQRFQGQPRSQYPYGGRGIADSARQISDHADRAPILAALKARNSSRSDVPCLELELERMEPNSKVEPNETLEFVL